MKLKTKIQQIAIYALRNAQSGFTLLELLLVIAIVAVLAGLIVFNLRPVQIFEDTNNARALSNANDLEKAINAYVLENNGYYPPELQQYFDLGAKKVSICKPGQVCVGVDLSTELVDGGYLTSIPINTGYDTSDKSGYDIILSNNNLNVEGQVAELSFILKDDFTTAESAPLTSPRTAEPGPGVLTITDTGNNLNISDGNLLLQGNTNGDPGVWTTTSLPRTSGLAHFTSFTANSFGTFYSAGFDINQGAAISESFRFTSGMSYYTGGVAIDLGSTPTTNVPYTSVNILRNNGGMVLLKGGDFPNWTLMYVDNLQTTTPVYPSITQNSAALDANIDSMTVTQLPAPFNDDYGIATQRLAGTRTNTDTFVHESDFVMEWTQTNVPTSGITAIRFRIQDSTNAWLVQVNSLGTLYLQEVIGGVVNTRSIANTAVTNGSRIVIVAEGSTVRGYSDNVLRWTYNTANNFINEDNGSISAIGTGGVVSDLVVYPRTLTGSAAAILDKAME